jgi:hypothetical protein
MRLRVSNDLEYPFVKQAKNVSYREIQRWMNLNAKSINYFNVKLI